MPHSRCDLSSLFPEQIPPSGATKARYPIMDNDMPCHLVSPRQFPPGVSLETHMFVSRDPFPKRLSGKPLKPRNLRTTGGNSEKMSQHRGAEQRCPRYL